jgi:hypothetical protein
MAAVVTYILSLGSAIPVVAIGPWPVWPIPIDFAFLLLLATCLHTRTGMVPMDKRELAFFKLAVVAVALTVPSNMLANVLFPRRGLSALGLQGYLGLLQSLRAFQYLMVWYCIRGMTFSKRQMDLISIAVACSLLATVILAVGNVSGLLPAARLASHLPAEGIVGYLYRDFSGASRPVALYGPSAGHMVNHLTILAAILLASHRPNAILRALLLSLVALVVWFTGSRAATIGWVVMLVVWMLQSGSVRRAVLVTVAAALLLALAPRAVQLANPDVALRATERFSSIARREQDPTMSGRVPRWGAFIDHIRSHPYVLATGAGWGLANKTVPDWSGNAHNMYLQVLTEVGVGGLIVYLALLCMVFGLLRGRSRMRAAVRAAFVGLLVAGFSGEVLYPQPYGFHILAALLAAAGIASASARGDDDARVDDCGSVHDELPPCDSHTGEALHS